MGVLVTLAFVLFVFFALSWALAGIFCKDSESRVGATILIGLGLIFVVGAIIFAGCSASMRGL
jgi:hypothetical protein